jgi:hypothetical protein
MDPEVSPCVVGLVTSGAIGAPAKYPVVYDRHPKRLDKFIAKRIFLLGLAGKGFLGFWL